MHPGLSASWVTLAKIPPSRRSPGHHFPISQMKVERVLPGRDAELAWAGSLLRGKSISLVGGSGCPFPEQAGSQQGY